MRRGPVLGIAIATSLGCRQPPAELVLSQPEGVEPSGIRGPSVFVEAPQRAYSGPLLDWTAVDDRFADNIEGVRYRVEYDADHPWAGASAPLVTIVVFSDYECPYCATFDHSLAQLRVKYRDELRVVWRQLPLAFHPNARLAARYALAAHEQGAHGLMHEWLFQSAKQLSRAAIEQRAAELGLDVLRLRADADSSWVAQRIVADQDLANELGVSGTPTCFINGRPSSGALPVENIDAIVRDERLVGERLVAAGSDRSEVWARVLAASQPGPVDWDSTKPTAPAKRYETKLSGLTPRGSNQAKIEILMCGDFDCPFCQRSLAVLDELRKRHGKDLAIYFRHMPLDFHKDAMPAHRAAVAAENQGELWAMFDLLYADPSQRSDAELEALAKQAGLKLSQFRKDVADPQTDATIAAQREFCEQQLDAKGTPTFFINGRSLAGAQPIEAFEAIIADELAATP